MEEILEIRDGCTTPDQLLKSLAFSRYLKMYKKAFIDDLKSRNGKQRQEAIQKINFIDPISARDFLQILKTEEFQSDAELEQARTLVRFLDGCFHHFRGTGYSRLVR
ncbi:MAG: hypothetical protein KAS48_02605, partial [Gammaproteobacteria bacterium]|nr:hypothetical protein [Gammaproteobacteria bacterium]